MTQICIVTAPLKGTSVDGMPDVSVCRLNAAQQKCPLQVYTSSAPYGYVGVDIFRPQAQTGLLLSSGPEMLLPPCVARRVRHHMHTHIVGS